MAQTTTETFGERVKRLRESKKVIMPLGEVKTMTQLELAVQSNCAECTISRIENNKQEPTLCVAKAIALALEVSLDYLAETC